MDWNPPVADDFDSSRRVSHHGVRAHHAVRVHLWEPEDACAQSCVRPARASLGLRDACAKAVACVWVDCQCAGHLHLSTLEHLNALEVDQSAIGRTVLLQLGHACARLEGAWACASLVQEMRAPARACLAIGACMRPSAWLGLLLLQFVLYDSLNRSSVCPVIGASP